LYTTILQNETLPPKQHLYKTGVEEPKYAFSAFGSSINNKRRLGDGVVLQNLNEGVVDEM